MSIIPKFFEAAQSIYLITPSLCCESARSLLSSKGMEMIHHPGVSSGDRIVQGVGLR